MISKEIYILGKALKLRQIEGGFHTGLDAVMLGAACPAKAGQSILDMGCGVGAAGLAAIYRVKDATLTGVDIQDDHIEAARENAAVNDLGARAEFICADIREFSEARFHHVICNPPYLEAGAHAPSPLAKRAKALGHEGDAALEDWVRCGFDCLKGRGSFTMIHRADMVDKIVQAFGKRFGAIEIMPLWPRAGVEAKRVIVRGIKHAKTPARIHAGLVLHEENGDYTAAAEKILREAAALY